MRHVHEVVLSGIHDGQGMALLECLPIKAFVAVWVEGHDHGAVAAVLDHGAVAQETVTLQHLGQEAPVTVW